MNVPEQIAQLSHALPPEKQAEILDFVEFLVARQPHTAWTIEQRQEIAGECGLLTRARRVAREKARRTVAPQIGNDHARSGGRKTRRSICLPLQRAAMLFSVA